MKIRASFVNKFERIKILDMFSLLIVYFDDGKVALIIGKGCLRI